ncbi:MAG: RidA family protein [Chlorobiales bacterium]|nr:RidA family protein [Chlorobiales bacterium]
MSAIEKRLTELGIVIPTPAKPLAAYTPAVKHGRLVFTAGQLPLVEGKLVEPGGKGKVNGDRKEEAKKAARVAAINTLAAVKSVIGDLDQIERIIKVSVFVASASGFVDQPFIANGASELYLEIFGDAGIHARSAVGMAELPFDASVEVELIVGLKQA